MTVYCGRVSAQLLRSPSSRRPHIAWIASHPACRRSLQPTRQQQRWAHVPSPGEVKFLKPLDIYFRRHVGPSEDDATRMLQSLNPPARSLDDFVSQTIPQNIRSERPLILSKPGLDTDEKTGGVAELTAALNVANLLAENRVRKSYIGAGYYGTIVPPVIKRNVLESPAWYTSYTPYQPEVSQGRLESLLNFQTMVSALTAQTRLCWMKLPRRLRR